MTHNDFFSLTLSCFFRVMETNNLKQSTLEILSYYCLSRICDFSWKVSKGSKILLSIQHPEKIHVVTHILA